MLWIDFDCAQTFPYGPIILRHHDGLVMDIEMTELLMEKLEEDMKEGKLVKAWDLLSLVMISLSLWVGFDMFNDACIVLQICTELNPMLTRNEICVKRQFIITSKDLWISLYLQCKTFMFKQSKPNQVSGNPSFSTSTIPTPLIRLGTPCFPLTTPSFPPCPLGSSSKLSGTTPCP